MKIKKHMMEFNKPSELTQILFIKKYKKEIKLIKINPLQLDLINGIFYRVKENLIKNNINILDDGQSTTVEFLMKDFVDLFKSYNNYEYHYIIESLDSLSDIKVVINALGKNKDIDELIITRFIQEMRISRHKLTSKKKIKLTIPNSLIIRFLDVKKYFSKMFFKIQQNFKSKYSKLLYELLKDYEKIVTKTILTHDLFDLLNVVDESQRKWSIFHQNILKKSVNEINQKSDIHVTYEPIKEKPEGQRLQVTKIKFNIRRQSESRLQQLGLIEEPITSLPFYNKSKSKLDKLVKNGYKVIDEDMWIETDIKKNESKYDAEVRIDTWLKETDKEDRNDLYKILAETLDDCDDPMVIIEDYRIVGLFTKDNFTKNPQETIEKLNEIIVIMNEYNQE